jgi:hypothetical protein
MSKRQKPALRRVAPHQSVADEVIPPLAPSTALQQNDGARVPDPVAKGGGEEHDADELLAQLEAAKAARQQREEAELRIKQQVADLLAEKGEAACQQLLVATILKVKKCESEVATAKKRREAIVRENEQLELDYKKLVATTKQIEEGLAMLAQDTSRVDAELEVSRATMAQRRQEVRAKIEGEVSELRRCVEQQAADDEAIVQENVVLRAQYDEQRKAFDDAFKQHEESWSSKEQETKDTLQGFAAQLREVQTLDAQTLMMERELKQLLSESKAYREQIDTYATKFVDFESVALKSEEVEKIAAVQRKQLQDKLDDCERERKRALELKAEFEKEAVHFRATHAALKKKLQTVEKTKSNLEGKCRKETERKMSK